MLCHVAFVTDASRHLASLDTGQPTREKSNSKKVHDLHDLRFFFMIWYKSPPRYITVSTGYSPSAKQSDSASSMATTDGVPPILRNTGKREGKRKEWVE